MRGLLLLLLLLVLGAPGARAQPVITEAAARAFVLQQEQAWNAGDLDRYFARFTADAAFTDQAYQGDKPPVLYGTSSLAEAKAQTRKAFARTRPKEAARIFRILVAADGRSAEVVTSVGVQIGPRRLCASRRQTLVIAGGGLKSKGQTDTYIRCRRR